MTGTQLFWLLIILGVIASFTTMVCVSIAHSHSENHSNTTQLPSWSSSSKPNIPDEKDLK